MEVQLYAGYFTGSFFQPTVQFDTVGIEKLIHSIAHKVYKRYIFTCGLIPQGKTVRQLS